MRGTSRDATNWTLIYAETNCGIVAQVEALKPDYVDSVQAMTHPQAAG